MPHRAPRCLPLGAFALAATSGCHAAPSAESPAPAAESAVNLPAPATGPANSIVNGDFSAGIAPWGAHLAGAPSATPPEPRLENGALCTTLHGGEELIIGW